MINQYTYYPVSGMTEQQATEILGVPVSIKNSNDAKEQYRVVEAQDSSIVAYCRDGSVYSVQIKAPFSGDVQGVKIGFSEEQVKNTLGEPEGVWHITQELDRWFYHNQTLRIDFDLNNRRVKQFYV